MLTWIFSPLEETKYLFRVGVWVWEAGLPQNVKPSTTTHYMIRLVGVGITSRLSVSERILMGWRGELRARGTSQGTPGVPSPREQGIGALWPMARTPIPALPGGFSKARGGKARAVGQKEPRSPAPSRPTHTPADSGPQAKEKELDFGNVMVNSKQSRWLVLLNEGHCTLYYHLALEQCSPESTNNEPLGTGPGWGWGWGWGGRQ